MSTQEHVRELAGWMVVATGTRLLVKKPRRIWETLKPAARQRAHGASLPWKAVRKELRRMRADALNMARSAERLVARG